MEDAIVLAGDFAGSGSSYFAVFDGHGGSEVSKYAANTIHRRFGSAFASDVDPGRLLGEVIAEVDQVLSAKFPDQGSTAGIAIVIKDVIYTANVGDTRIVLAGPDGSIRQLSVDHRATDPVEKELIVKRGGRVLLGRANGILALSRSLGDGALKDVITAEPFMAKARRKDGQILIVACDGVWDVLDNDTAVKIARQKTSPQAAAIAIKDEAIRRGTGDNVSVIVVFLTLR
jgi:serine/threonine protein phosphatase PrpC